MLLRLERASERGGGQRLREGQLLNRRGRPVERVELDRAAGDQLDRLDAERSRERPVLAFGIADPRAPPEHRLAVAVRLDEAALGDANLADDEHVRVGEDAALVERERVVDERAAVEIAADVDAVGSRGRPR